MDGSILRTVFRSLPGRWLAGAYRRSAAASLNEYGLKAEDLWNEFSDEHKLAISRVDAGTYDERNRRLKRALDISLKHETMHGFDGAALESYMGTELAEAEAELVERAEIVQPKLF
eukprot:PLAT13368.1.p2 GENE.PLAT13368.1~~PLAT13368.1.p2  ORF type:complete len:123 (+),score=58.49 PLAT13368.1:23-370(+)